MKAIRLNKAVDLLKVRVCQEDCDFRLEIIVIRIAEL
jgi:hypothetical protein